MQSTTNAPALAAPLSIGGLTVPNRALLAPLAGVSDAPFRRICQELGAGLTYVEMLSAAALRSPPKRHSPRLTRNPAEALLGVQVTGPEAALVAEAVAVLDQMPYDTIDINMGCPVRKIVSRGSGCAILKDPERVSLTAQLAVAATRKPLTAKIRIGYEAQTRNVEEIARRLAGAGVAMITIHGRTRDDNYGVPVDRIAITAGVAAARAEGRTDLVLVANGDIFDPAGARRMCAETGCDAVMISRGALGNPWLFRQIIEPGAPHPHPAEWREVVVRHLRYHCEHYENGPLTVPTFRKHLQWYASGFPSMRRAREALNTAADVDTVLAIIDSTLMDMDPALRRYDADQHASGRHRVEAFDPKGDMDREADRAEANEAFG